MSRIVPLDPSVNTSYLKLDLYCRGARLHESCFVQDAGAMERHEKMERVLSFKRRALAAALSVRRFLLGPRAGGHAA